MNLSLPAGVARGGESGVVIVPSQLMESRLWQLIDQDVMPEGSPLSAEEKQILQRWILAGAPGLPSADEGSLASDSHWAFQKWKRPALPVVKQQATIRNALDAHIAVPLEAAGLKRKRDQDSFRFFFEKKGSGLFSVLLGSASWLMRWHETEVYHTVSSPGFCAKRGAATVVGSEGSNLRLGSGLVHPSAPAAGNERMGKKRCQEPLLDWISGSLHSVLLDMAAGRGWQGLAPISLRVPTRS